MRPEAGLLRLRKDLQLFANLFRNVFYLATGRKFDAAPLGPHAQPEVRT